MLSGWLFIPWLDISRKQRNFSDMDLIKLRQDASIITAAAGSDWSSLLSIDCIDEKVNVLNSKLTCLHDVHAPVCVIKIQHLPAPWLTAEIRSLISIKKSIAKSRLKTRPMTSNRNRHIAIQNICSKAQRQYIHNPVEKGDPSKVLKFLRTLGVWKS